MIGMPSIIPENLWSHQLFQNSAEFQPPATPLTIARIEERLRRIRRMPSASDLAVSKIYTGIQDLAVWATNLLENLPANPTLEKYHTLQTRIQQILTLTPDDPRRPTLLRALKRLAPTVCMDFLPLPDSEPAAFNEALRFCEFLALDHYLSILPAIQRRYLRRVYRIAEAALQYNTTTDAPRMLPVLAWVQHLLKSDNARGLSYVDVGCAFNGGAPALPIAARILRADNLCRLIHGTDITPPPLTLQSDLWREQRIGIYQTDPLARPLPRCYDIIMLANVHRHLTRDMQQDLLTHLAASLNNNGRLFVTWRFDRQNNPCICLTLQNSRLVITGNVKLE